MMTGGAGGVGVVTEIGSGNGEVGPGTAEIGSPGAILGSVPSGGCGTGGLSVAKAEHLIVGFPVVPGGQVQNGLFPAVLQSPLSPQSPG